MGASLNWLKEQVENISFDEMLFRVSYGENKYVFGAMYTVQTNELDIFAVNSIYNTIIDLNNKIKYSFEMVEKCKPSEKLSEHNMFVKPPKNEKKAFYYIENMLFRTSTLWDMLAQLCNIFWKINKPINKIYTSSFFHDCSKGKNAKPFAQDVYKYFEEDDNVKGDLERWEGNFKYTKEYRNKMTHRNSPSTTTLSNFDLHLRPPAIFVLKRVTEDYLTVTEFIQRILDDILLEIEKATS